jgi:hypothetical protein
LEHGGTLPDSAGKSKLLLGRHHDETPQAAADFAAAQRLTPPENVAYLSRDEIKLPKRFT